jgi:prephenate dehydrogenase
MGVNTKFTRPQVGVIGGTGRMGSWFADLLERRGSKVFRVGRKTEVTPAEAAQQCDVVVISVPVGRTVKVIQEIGPLVSEDALLMDLTSIKKAPVEAMLEYSSAEVVGAHPLFGPDITSNSELRLAICPGRGKSGLDWLLGVLKDADLGVTILSPEEHDHMMGLVQGVNHFSTLTLALFISRSGLKFEDLVNCSTQTFRQRLDRIKSIIEQPAELFGSLMMDNPPAEEFIGQYLEAARDLIKITKAKDRKIFEKTFVMLKEFFNGCNYSGCHKDTKTQR